MDFTWVDGMFLAIGAIIGMYLKKAATWVKEKLSAINAGE